MAKPQTAWFASGWTESFAALPEVTCGSSVICYIAAKKETISCRYELCLLRDAKTLMSADRRTGDRIHHFKVAA